MTQLNDATKRQHVAARPDRSTWLSANAGSGKTRVLTDRVARLLLDGVAPQHILCLTYTKAAASEMQNRLFKGLGAWAMLDDSDLTDALRALGYDGFLDDAGLRRARTLFALAIETPGGLKIQTIHSFCASLLRRFPLEAGVSPQFTEIEDRAAELLRAELLDQIASGPDADLLAEFTTLYSGDDILNVTRQIVSNAGKYTLLSAPDCYAAFGLPTGTTRARLVADTFAPGDAEMIRDLLPYLHAGSSTDQKAARKLAALGPLDFDAIPLLASVMVNASGANAGQANLSRFPTKDTRNAAAHLIPALHALMNRIADAADQHKAILAADQTLILHRFAARFCALYDAAKQARAWLDFDDLILKARQLLTDEKVAAWVLYRLDGGIDHILVDEAQDTSPAQWDVIRKLAEEFSSGAGARDTVQRTIFVVGDKKQSIYSFQGADPGAFDSMQSEFGSKLSDSGQELHDLTLDHSFRSSPAILTLVDKVFEPTEGAGFAPGNHHVAFHQDMPGRVDLWPVVPKPESESKSDWYDPIDRTSPENEHRVLAGHIAQEIKRLIDTQAPIEDNGDARPVEPRDFLILVQKRSGIFSELIRACKAARLPIAGADRLKVGGELAVRDLGALLSFLATPEDSLSLATALRSPLFGWTEQMLFTLAHHRTEDHLWQALRKSEDHPKTVSVLEDMRSQIDFLRPYDLIERMLTRHRGRQKLLARLGAEAEDGIDALLAQALAYERTAIPSLTGFLTWMQTDDLEIKRQIDSASNQIRVMTVHGAKGLEAPIVILPECGKRTFQYRDPLVDIGETPVWKPNKPQQPEIINARIEEIATAQQQESLRLLYVALTRAEKWLIVAASGQLDSKGQDWWQRVEGGMNACGAAPLDTPTGPGLRFSHGTWPDSAAHEPPQAQDTTPSLSEVFKRSAPQPGRPEKPITPSDLGGPKALPGEGRDSDTATAYGTLVHILLERLPGCAPEHRADIARRIASTSGLDPADAHAATSEALAVMEAPELAHLFGPDILAEVPFVATLNGQPMRGTIDRLLHRPGHVHIVDFKSNRVVPATAQDVPMGLVLQMAAYAQAAQQIFPDHAVQCSILWTRTRHLMALPHDIVTAALDDTPYLDVP